MQNLDLSPRSPRLREPSALAQSRRLSVHWLLALAAAGAFSCGSSGGEEPRTGAQSKAVQSSAAYDIAADLWMRQQQPRQALEQALSALKLDNENADAQHLVALLYLDFCRRDEEECRLSEAETHARAALEAREDFREAQNTLGVILVHQKRYGAAIQVLRTLTQDILYQTPENAWGNLGWAYLENGQVQEAIDALLRCTAVQPDFCVGHYRLAMAYERKKQWGPALQAYNRALAVEHPRCRAMQVAYPARARLLVQLGRQDDAVTDLEECVHLDKNTASGRQCRAQLGRIQPSP
ncbi:MAG: hypothetical protein RJA70_2260 [Pseudomonadota bacterium]|jgi:Tfp pilus assembly protein PilF